MKNTSKENGPHKVIYKIARLLINKIDINTMLIFFD